MKFITQNVHSLILKRFLLLLFLFTLFTIVNAFSYVNAISSNIADNLFRLHVISNSNSIEDQALKHLVRDGVLQYIDTNTDSLVYVDDTFLFITANIEDIREVAQSIVYDNGYNYSVTTQIGNFKFPTKQYADIRLPAGFYNSLKIELGEGIGSNWWCVMFPPLCFIDISSPDFSNSSREIMQDVLSEEEYRLISGSSPDIRLKFRVLEVLQNIVARI